MNNTPIYSDDSAIEKLLTFLAPSSWTTASRLRMRMFNEPVPFFGPFVDMLSQWSPSPGIWADAEPDATGTLTNISVLGNPDAKHATDFMMLKLKYASKSKMHLLIGEPYRNTGTLRMTRYDGRLVDGKPTMEMIDGRSRASWMSIIGRNQMSAAREDWSIKKREFYDAVRVLPGIYFNLYHQWSVCFNIPTGSPIRFPIEPRIALELFCDREKEPGKLRRDALLHWVKAHLRKKHGTPNDMTEVRKHIRGRERFFWRGFNCVISPDDDYLQSLESGD